MDNLTPQELPAEPVEGAPEEKQSFLSTPRGKIILIVGAILGFLVVCGIVAALVFTFFIKGLADDAVEQIATDVASQVSTSTVDTEEPEVIVEPALVPLSDLFTFRDIFDPLIEPASAEPTESVETSSTFVGAEDTLYLLDIVVEGGVNKAVLSLNGAESRLAEGESISGTPWQVLSIGASSVVMLYGDSQVSLSVGQGVVDSTTSTTASTSAK